MHHLQDRLVVELTVLGMDPDLLTLGDPGIERALHEPPAQGNTDGRRALERCRAHYCISWLCARA